MAELLCPICHSSIERRTEREYVCSNCANTYPVFDGIPVFASAAEGEDSYDKSNFEFVFEIQKRHFWFVGRSEILYVLLEQVYHSSLSNMVMIEIGCGCGSILRFLDMKGLSIEGADVFLEALQFCTRHTDAPLYQLDAQRTPFADNQYDIVGLFDVLEHIEDDQAVLKEMRRICKPGGRIVLTVPAYKWLWSYIDTILCHKRRYNKKELHRKLLQAGFVVERVSFFMFFLFPVLFAYRRLRNIRTHSDHALSSLTETQTIPLINGVFLSILRLERFLIKHMNLPMGTSLVAVARKET